MLKTESDITEARGILTAMLLDFYDTREMVGSDCSGVIPAWRVRLWIDRWHGWVERILGPEAAASTKHGET